MRKLLLLLFLFFVPLFEARADFVTISNCDNIPTAQRLTNGTFCLQTTTVGGRTAGTTWVWNGSTWVASSGGGGSAAAGASGDVQYSNGSSGFQAESVFNYSSSSDLLTVPNANITTLLTAPKTDITGAVRFTADVSPSQITSNQDNYAGCAITANVVCRLNTDASRNITGLSGGTDGAIIFLYNVGSFNIVLKNLITSTASNQFSIAADITVGSNQGIILQYDATSAKWRAASGISGGGGQAADNDLTALAGLTGTGAPYRTGTDTWVQRSLAGTANRIVVTNPDGIVGPPTFNLGSLAVQTDQSNTFSAGDQNLAGAASFTFPTAAGAAPTISGRCAYDSTVNRLKCGFNGATVTLATTAETQPLSSNLSSIAALSGANNLGMVFTGAGSLSTYNKPSCSGANQAVNWDSTTHTESCVTFTGGISGLTTGKLPKAASATTLTDSIISESAGVATVGGGLTVGSSPFLVLDTSAVATSDKTWTVMNFSGTIRPSTGAITAGHVLTVDANGLIVDGGVAGSGTWTDSSTSTGTNKTLVATEAGGTNTITTGIAAYWDGGAIVPDGTNCTDATKTTINSGPTEYVVVCADNNSSTFDGSLMLKQAVATVTFTLTVNDVDSSSQHFAGGFKAQCRNNNTTVNSTWGTAQTVDITMATANNNYTGTTSAVTPNGTCSAGATLFWRFTVDATTNTDDGDARVIGVLMKQSS